MFQPKNQAKKDRKLELTRELVAQRKKIRQFPLDFPSEISTNQKSAGEFVPAMARS